MPKIHVVQGAQRGAGVSGRAAALRRCVMVAGTVGLTAGAGLLSASSAAASNGSQPGNLLLHPASGPTTTRPTFSTTTACPVGYQAAAEVSAFHANGTFGSRISYVVSSDLTHPFSGMLDFKMNLLLKFGSRVAKGQGSEWAVGCYSGAGATGRVKWVQSTFVTLSSAGTSYSTGAQSGSTSSSAGQPASTGGNAQGAPTAATSGGSSQLEATSIAGACGLVIAVGGIAWYRRRSRAGLQ